MTKHLDRQPQRCLQCLKIGLLLTHGRCNTCRSRTPAAVWNDYYGATGIRMERFQQPELKPPLVSALFPVESLEQIMTGAEEKTLTMMQGGA